MSWERPIERARPPVRARVAAADREAGEWFATLGPDCAPRDDSKGGRYKGQFHTADACDVALRHLDGAGALMAAAPA